ncbi:hypothetical protein N0V90_007651 [Kalmusia sp. IMI 367209]|nr:hypothetical protein N0V90_007651 [Kalmusia sp. IMI 367209]
MRSDKKRRKELRKERRKQMFQQLRLGVTENNELTLVKFVMKKPTPKPIIHYEADPELFSHLPFPQLSKFEVALALQPPFQILRLPEELVLQILTEAVRTEYRKWRTPRLMGRLTNFIVRFKRTSPSHSIAEACQSVFPIVGLRNLTLSFSFFAVL